MMFDHRNCHFISKERFVLCFLTTPKRTRRCYNDVSLLNVKKDLTVQSNIPQYTYYNVIENLDKSAPITSNARI